jgi:cyanophycin synthetase
MTFERYFEFFNSVFRVAPILGLTALPLRPGLEYGEPEKFPSNTIPGFVDRLIEWLPSLYQHQCSVGEVGGFVWRLRDGTWPAHIIEHVAIELQTLAERAGQFR